MSSASKIPAFGTAVKLLGVVVGSIRNHFSLSPAKVITFKESRSKLPNDFPEINDDYVTMLLVVRNQAATLFVAGVSRGLQSYRTAASRGNSRCGGDKSEAHFDRFVVWKLRPENPTTVVPAEKAADVPMPLSDIRQLPQHAVGLD